MNRVEKGMPYVACALVFGVFVFALIVVGPKLLLMLLILAAIFAVLAGTAWVVGWIKEKFEWRI